MKAYPAYKDSGLAWMPEIPEHWRIERLQWHLREVKVGNSPIKTNQVLSLTNKKGVIPYEEKGNQGNKAKESLSEYKLAYPNTLVMNSMNVIIGSVGISNYFGCVSPVYYIFKTLGDSSLAYINYIFQTTIFQKELRKYANGILEIRLRLSVSNILKRPIPIPPIEEQKAIVAYLDKKCAEIEELISRRQAIIERLKELKQSIIAETVTKGLNPDVPMKESGVSWLGSIPEHWRIKRFGTVFTERKTKVSDKEYPPISVTKLGILPQLETAVKTDNGDNRKLVLKGDFVINSRSDRKGSSGISPYNGSVSLISLVLIPEAEWNHSYIHHLLRSVPFQEEFYQKGHGIVADLWTTRYTDIASAYLPEPPYEEQHAIVAYLDKKCAAIDELVSRHEQTIEKLKELKTVTIADVVTGKVDVRESI